MAGSDGSSYRNGSRHPWRLRWDTAAYPGIFRIFDGDRGIIRRSTEYVLMAAIDTGSNSHRSQWRELSRSLIQREVLYTISGFPDGVREAKIKTLIPDVFKYSFQESVATHLKELEKNGYLSKESTKSGATIWHADHSGVLNLVEQELAAMKHRETELRELHAYLVELYGD